MKANVTMKDIAKRAGVTTATVSMSLRAHPHVSVATRERIVALAEEMGYRPNPLISALMRVRRRRGPMPDRPVLAFVSALDRRDGWRNAPSLTRRMVYEGAVARAEELGYKPQEFWLNAKELSAERLSQVLRARGVDGILLGPVPDGAPPPPLRWEYFSVVSISVPPRLLPLQTVCNDHYFSSQMAMRECHRRGYRRPALVMRRSHREHFHGRWEGGVLSAQRSLSDVVPLDPYFVENLEEVDAFDLRAFRRWLGEAKPDVIITLAADFVRDALSRAGMRAPRDIGLASLSCPVAGHDISGIFQDGHLIGATGIDILVNMVERHQHGLLPRARTTMIEGFWNEGTTLRPPPAGADATPPAE